MNNCQTIPPSPLQCQYQCVSVSVSVSVSVCVSVSLSVSVSLGVSVSVSGGVSVSVTSNVPSYLQMLIFLTVRSRTDRKAVMSPVAYAEANVGYVR